MCPIPAEPWPVVGSLQHHLASDSARYMYQLQHLALSTGLWRWLRQRQRRGGTAGVLRVEVLSQPLQPRSPRPQPSAIHARARALSPSLSLSLSHTHTQTHTHTHIHTHTHTHTHTHLHTALGERGFALAAWKHGVQIHHIHRSPLPRQLLQILPSVPTLRAV
jgi:hypothetical protein